MYLSGLSGVRPGKLVAPPETGETKIRPPGGLRRRCDHKIDWFTSCFVVLGVRRPERSVVYLSGLSGEQVARPGATQNRKARIWPGPRLRFSEEGSQEGTVPGRPGRETRVDRRSGGAGKGSVAATVWLLAPLSTERGHFLQLHSIPPGKGHCQ